MTPARLTTRFRQLALILVLLGCAPLALHAQTDNGAGGVTLNLKDADIRSLIETVAQATGTNFVIDPRVKAKVTVISSQPMNPTEVYQVFLSILQVHGFSAVPAGEVIKIVPDVNAKQGPVAVTTQASPGRGDQLVTRVIPIQNVPAAQMVPILRPLVPQQGHLAAYAASNALIISDRAANIARLAKIISRIDTAEVQDIEVIRLEFASAQEVVRIISGLQSTDAKGGKVPGQPTLIADDRTNSVLVGGDKAARLRVRALVAHLDTPLESGGNTQVVFLKYAKAEELAPILLGVSRQQAAVAATTTGGQVATAAGGAAAAVQRVTRASSAGSSGNDIDIQADERNNALVITAPQDRIDSIKSVIRQLDIRRAQVLVEAIIAEVSTDLMRDLGVQFAVIPDGVEDRGPVAISNIGGSGSSIAEIAGAIAANGAQAVGGLGTGLLVGAADLRDGKTNFAFLLQALDGDAATNILSTPTLVTLDNEEAEIVVGQNVPFVTGSTTSGGDGTSNPFQTIERQDVGVTLRITPQINEGDSVKLDIEQESSSVAASSAGAADLITNTRSIKTSVLVQDDGVLVLGGLIDDTFRDTQTKVPVLGDVPLLGRLFRFDSTEKAKQSLMVFIHPRIMRNDRTAELLTNQKYGLLRSRQLDSNLQNRGLFKGGAGRLPPLNELVTRVPGDLNTELRQELNRTLE